MEPKLFKYIWRHSSKEQLFILLLVAVSMPFYFVSLDLPKSIVNQGIQGEGFEGPGSTRPFLGIEVPFTDPAVRLFDGFTLEQADFLLALSFAFLFFVFINGAFKFVINTLKGRMGERMLRRLRFELGDRVLRFPVIHSRRVKQAEVATMIKDEVEPLGGFIGDAFVTPAFLGGQAITAMTFIMLQSVWLGMVAAAIVGIQAFLIPRLRRRILVLGRERQLTARQLAGRIGELVDGSTEIHAHDTSNYERSDLSSRLGRIFKIRVEIFQRKFFVKFLNNFLAQLTPFVFYSAGGLLALGGRLDIGALVAVIAAYKDLPGPIKELIDWDQQRLDVQIKYEQVIEQFQPPDLIDPAAQSLEADRGAALEGELACFSVSLVDDANTRLVDGVSFKMDLTEHLAVVGSSSSGKDHLGLLLANLVKPSAGSISINGSALDSLPQAVTGQRLSYVGQDAYLFPQSVLDNLLYGLKHRPAGLEEAAKSPSRDDLESLRAGNVALDPQADWIDYDAAGAKDLDSLQERVVEALSVVELEEDVYRFGLTGTVDPEARPAVAAGILRAREALLERLAAEDASDLVIRFDPEAYNLNATLAENLLFGTPTKDSFREDALAENPVVLAVLEEKGLLDDLAAMGETIARTMVELFADLPAGHPFFEQFGFIDEDELPEFRTLVARIEKSGRDSVAKSDQLRLRSLPMRYIEARHRLELITKEREGMFIEARKRIAELLQQRDPEAVQVYRPDAYITAASIQDNILFGRVVYGRPQAGEVIGRAVREVLDSLDLRRTVLIVGLDYQVGLGGKRLTNVQRQKLAVCRALLKQPDLLIMNEAGAVMDAATQKSVLDRVLATRAGKGTICTLQRAAAADSFDRVLVMRAGKLVAEGTFKELNESGSELKELVAAG